MSFNLTQTRLGILFAAILLAFCVWQNPGMVIDNRLSAAEIDAAVRYVDQNLPFDPADKAMVLNSLRAWGEADDGQPVYMLNLMRYFERMHTLPGAARLDGTPRQNNARYEDQAMALLLKAGGYALYAGNVQGPNILEHRAGMDHWSRVLLVRYTSRRAFLKLLTDPAYAPIEPYKMLSLELILAPTTSELIIPDLRFVLGAVLLAVFLLCGWLRARRQGAWQQQSAQQKSAVRVSKLA